MPNYDAKQSVAQAVYNSLLRYTESTSLLKKAEYLRQAVDFLCAGINEYGKGLVKDTRLKDLEEVIAQLETFVTNPEINKLSYATQSGAINQLPLLYTHINKLHALRSTVVSIFVASRLGAFDTFAVELPED